MKAARLIIDPPLDCAWNMAVDEALLRSAAETDQLTLRLYRWASPTVSLGYFQAHGDRALHPSSGGCPIVRRATGGGAILHDRELTYSLTAPARDRTDRQLRLWYDWVHVAWVDTFCALGIPATRCPATDSSREQRFLCFERRAAGDLLLDGYKIGGSAQRRHQYSALQHGSLLLARSSAAPELPGISELARPLEADGPWRQQWLDTLAGRLNVVWVPGELSQRERSWASDLVHGKFRHQAWTLRR